MAFAFYSGSRPIVGVTAAIPLPIVAADILTALGPNIAAIPSANDTISNIVNAQVILGTLTPGTVEYVNRANSIQTWMRSLGLYPVGQSTGPSPILGY